MISTTDLKYFVDPIVKITTDVSKVFVLEVKHERNSVMVGQIINVKGFSVESNRLWFVTENGMFVYGPAVGSPTTESYSVGIVKLAGDVFAVGELNTYRRTVGRQRVLVNARRSDNKRMPGAAPYIPANDWFPAAEWAFELMPSEGDPQSVVDAKVAVAKQKWTNKNAKAEILRQGIARSWHADLKVLQDEGVLFNPMYGAYVAGQAFIPINEGTATLSEYERAQLEVMKKSKIASGQQEKAYIGLPVAFVADIGASTIDAAKMPDPTILTHEVRRSTGNSYALMGPATVVPVLTGIY